MWGLNGSGLGCIAFRIQGLQGLGSVGHRVLNHKVSLGIRVRAYCLGLAEPEGLSWQLRGFRVLP